MRVQHWFHPHILAISQFGTLSSISDSKWSKLLTLDLTDPYLGFQTMLMAPESTGKWHRRLRWSILCLRCLLVQQLLKEVFLLLFRSQTLLMTWWKASGWKTAGKAILLFRAIRLKICCSGGYMGDMVFNGGLSILLNLSKFVEHFFRIPSNLWRQSTVGIHGTIKLDLSNVNRFTVRNITVNNALTAVQSDWNWGRSLYSQNLR